MYELTAGHHRIRILSHTCSVCADDVGLWGWCFFLLLFFFVGKLSEAVNVMQTLCRAPAVEYPIKKQ